jgi:hypothetical protein
MPAGDRSPTNIGTLEPSKTNTAYMERCEMKNPWLRVSPPLPLPLQWLFLLPLPISF